MDKELIIYKQKVDSLKSGKSAEGIEYYVRLSKDLEKKYNVLCAKHRIEEMSQWVALRTELITAGCKKFGKAAYSKADSVGGITFDKLGIKL